MSASYTRVLSLFLAAALGLTPQLAQAFAFDTAMEPFFVLQNQTTGSPVVWTLPQVMMSVHLGGVPPGTTLANGTTSWDASVAEALALWNTVVPNFFTMDTTEADPCDRRNGVNTVMFTRDHCGDSFGDVVAITRKSYRLQSGHFFLAEADVVLNANLCWNAYAGPLHLCKETRNLTYAIDLQRVILHELGHVLGLEHPDDAGQTVVALMNSHLSDVDTLMQDDRDGAVFLYSQPSLTASLQASSGSGSGGGCTLRPGMDVNPTLGGVLLFLAVGRTWIRTRRAPACGRGTARRIARGRRQAPPRQQCHL
jgi:predicted Zn-dependent protease